jgi:Right handed beta helix region
MGYAMDTRTNISQPSVPLCVACLALTTTALFQSTAYAVTANSYGIVSGDENAATANTAALRRLVSPTKYGGASTYAGEITFPDGTIYYFNDVIPFRDGIHVDLQGSTLHFSKSADRGDIGAGFIFAIRDFSISNGRIEVDYNGTGFAHAGSALALGQRWSNGGSYFQPLLDSQLPSPMGAIAVSNLQITSNNPSGACGISMFGGLQNVNLRNISIDGEGQLKCGIYYEFGQATQPLNPASKPTPAPPYTSHAHDMTFVGISVANLNPRPGAQTMALGLGGAYATVVDGLTVTGVVDTVFSGTAGEASFYKMWPTQVPAAERTVTLRNISADIIRTSALTLAGSGSFRAARCTSASNPEGYCGFLGRYLDPSSYLAASETDEINYVVDGFNLKGASITAGWGIYASARSVDIRNGTLSGFRNGIVVTDDCTKIQIDNIRVQGSGLQGIRMDFGAGLWNPPRPKTGYIKGSLIAGSGVSAPGSFGITLNSADTFLIEGNTFGDAAEGSQGGALLLGSSARNVVARKNNVVGIQGNGPAYVSRTGAPGSGDSLQGNTGKAVSQGSWVTPH